MQRIKDLFKKIYYSKRVRSFLWRLGAVSAIAGLNYAQANITEFQLSDWAVMGIGLIGGEITKYLNNLLNGKYVENLPNN